MNYVCFLLLRDLNSARRGLFTHLGVFPHHLNLLLDRLIRVEKVVWVCYVQEVHASGSKAALVYSYVIHAKVYGSHCLIIFLFVIKGD